MKKINSQKKMPPFVKMEEGWSFWRGEWRGGLFLLSNQLLAGCQVDGLVGARTDDWPTMIQGPWRMHRSTSRMSSDWPEMESSPGSACSCSMMTRLSSWPGQRGLLEQEEVARSKSRGGLSAKASICRRWPRTYPRSIRRRVSFTRKACGRRGASRLWGWS